MEYNIHEWDNEDGTCRFHDCDSDATHKLVINRNVGKDEIHGCESCCNEYLLEDDESVKSRVAELNEREEDESEEDGRVV